LGARGLLPARATKKEATFKYNGGACNRSNLGKVREEGKMWGGEGDARKLWWTRNERITVNLLKTDLSNKNITYD